jgi:XTP/dITP diphosphohydrolase
LINLVLATRNCDKISEIQQFLDSLQVRILTFRDIEDLPIIEETGRSLFENAFKKAQGISNWTRELALSDDSGLEVDYLNGAPGVFSSRFAGEEASYDDNNSKLLELLRDVPEEKRTARFRCVMVLYFPEGTHKRFDGVLGGRITASKRGICGFGYDPIFLVPELGKTLAELDSSEKNTISHRGKALMKVLKFLKKGPCEKRG